MKAFLNDLSNGKFMVDKVFKSAVAAKEAKEIYGDEAVVDATLGTLFDEDGVFVAFDSIWTPFETISKIQKAKYASSIQGNPGYQEAVKTWLFGDFKDAVSCDVIATPGGAGAISATLKNTLNPGETVIKPLQGWGPYKTMAKEFDLNLKSYNMFNGQNFDLEDFFSVTKQVMDEQGKVVVIINDPCHNPTGYTLSSAEWDQILNYLNTLSKQGPVILLNDIAYADFNNLEDKWKKHFLKYTNLAENVMVVIAFSTSKTLTAYGARAGAQVVITKHEKDRKLFTDAAIYSARSIWSTVNNSAMVLFETIVNDSSLKAEYLIEKRSYIKLLKERADIFVKEAYQGNLAIYPYKEGFFVTIEIQDSNEAEILHKKLMEHNIFTVIVDGGLRIAICSVPKQKLKGLAKRIKEII